MSAKGLDYSLNMETKGFTGPLNGAQSALGNFKGMAASAMAGIGVAVAAAGAALKGLSLAFDQASAAVGEAANFEELQTAFIPLLGSVKAAKERMEELAMFAEKTPFEMPGIAKASRTLETLTNGALSMGEGLTLVGDIASGTNKPIEDMAVTMGRLYAALMSGRPMGEAAAQLSELGALSPEVRGKLEELQAQGKKGSEVWKVAAADLSKFSGGMALQAKTWNGKISNLEDAWASFQRAIGTPIMDALKPLLDQGIGIVEKMIDKAKQIGETIGYGIRFMIQAFKDGQAWELAKLGLTLAFQEGVNYLWRALSAVFKMIPTYLVQAFKTGIMVFDILTDAKFWGLVGEALWGALRWAVNGIFGALAEGLAKIMNLIPGMDNAADWTRGLADEFSKDSRRGSAEAVSAGAEFIDAYGERLLNQVTENYAELGKSFMKGWKEAEDVFDTGGVKDKLAEIKGSIDAKFAIQDAKRKSKEEKDIRKAGGPAADGAAEDGEKFKINYQNLFESSLAKVGGGGYGFRVATAESISQKQLDEQKTTNKKLDKLIEAANQTTAGVTFLS